MSEKNSGQGTIYFNNQRKKWNAQVNYYDIHTGELKKRTKSFDTKQEAEKYIATMNYQKENPIFIKNNGIPMCELLKSNIKLKLNTNQISPTQYGRVLKTINALEKTSFGNKSIEKIKSDEIQEYLNSLTYLSNSMIEKAHQQLNQAFKLAMNKGYIMQNPMINVIRPKSDKEDRVVRALEVEEQQKLTDYLRNKSIKDLKYKNVLLFQLYMGLRVGETLALTTHDVDLHNRKLNIHRTLSTDENGAIIMSNQPKTYAGNRILPIPAFLMPYFIEQINYANSQKNNDEKLLFKPNDSQYVRRSNINKELQRILEKNFGIKGISSHSLRHTYGTRCIESGMAPVVVQRLMGHKDIRVTLNTYTSVLNKFKESEIDKVNQYYLNQKLINNSNLFDDNLTELSNFNDKKLEIDIENEK